MPRFGGLGNREPIHIATDGQMIPLHSSSRDIEARQMLALLTMTIPNIRQSLSAKRNRAAKAFTRICLNRGDDGLLYRGERLRLSLLQEQDDNF